MRVFGKDLGRERIEILRRCNFSSAYTSLPNNLYVWQNLLVFARVYGVKNAKPKIESLLELFEVSHLRDRVTGHLSAGESTRVNLCKALLNDPELLMLDEPTASLDPDIHAVHWLDYEEILALSARMRSPLVLAVIERHRQGAEIVLETL